MANWKDHSEWCGIVDGKEQEPKSFTNFDATNKRHAYSGLLSLILDNFDDSKKKSETGNASLDVESDYFLEIVLTRTLRKLLKDLQAHLKPSFQRRIDNLSAIRGKIDFAKSNIKNKGLLHKHVCSFPELYFNDPLLRFLKNVTSVVPSWIAGRKVSKLVENDILHIVYLLRDTRSSDNIKEDATSILHNQLKFGSKYSDLLPTARILASFVIDKYVGLNKKSDNLHVPGLLLNLNGPFENLMKSALVATHKFHVDTEKFNSVREIGGPDKNYFLMKPDCRGLLDRNGVKSYAIFDAKHKLMTEEHEVRHDEDEDEVSCKRILRSDFYQIISYAETHKMHRDLPCYYTLVGLIEEASTPDSTFVKALPAIVINQGADELKIIRLSVRFGSLLCKLGQYSADSLKYETTLNSFGTELQKALEASKAVNLRVVDSAA